MTDATRTLANRYLLEGAIGRGGMGVVHRARDRQLERPVAVKLVTEAADPEAKERFVAEARRTANVRHPSIVEVFDVGEDAGDAFLVMELLEGETLGDRLKREGALAVRDAISIAGEICDALGAAHDAGLVHRDLKPANVFLVARAPGGRRVKLLDFGIAKRIDGGTARTDPNMLVGTLEYMAPEQIRGGRLDGRADLYALGMTMYRMLTGVPALDGDNAAALVHQHLSVTPPALSTRANARELPAWLDALVMRLLAKEPADRPASAHDVKRALESGDVSALGGDTLREAAGAAGAAPSRAAPAAPEPTRGRMREVELDEEDVSAPRVDLELDRGPERPPPRVPVRAPQPEPFAPTMPAAPLATHEPLPSWLEPLAQLPVGLSKRVTGYSLFALAIYVVFFHASLLPSLFLLAVAAVGGLAMWASSRASR